MTTTRETPLSLDAILNALADSHRRKIAVELLDSGTLSCKELSERIGLSGSAASYHFKVLREAGVTQVTKNGNQRLMSLRHQEVDQVFPGLLDSVLTPNQ